MGKIPTSVNEFSKIKNMVRKPTSGPLRSVPDPQACLQGTAPARRDPASSGHIRPLPHPLHLEVEVDAHRRDLEPAATGFRQIWPPVAKSSLLSSDRPAHNHMPLLARGGGKGVVAMLRWRAAAAAAYHAMREKVEK